MKKITPTLVLLIFSLFSSYLSAQNIPIKRNDLVIQGYQNKISGNDISFHSHLPNVTDAIIVRTTNGNQAIEWESEKLPTIIKNNFINIIWVSGISGLMHGKTAAPITLYANGKKIVTFHTGGVKAWDLKGSKGSSLAFREHLKDGSDDRFGYMYLRLPKEFVTPGKSVNLKFVAENYNTDSWTMVFKTQMKSSEISVTCQPAIRKKDGKQLLSISYYNFGAPQTALINFKGNSYKKEIEFGQNNIEIPIEPVLTNETLPMEIALSDKVYKKDVKLIPARKWEANFMQITHTDIGYTRPQTDILAEHVRFLDYVLDYCDATDSYPDAAKFRWTCEGAWAVKEFLRSRPQSQIDRFIKRVKEGRIELTAMYFNFDELPDEQTLAASLDPLKEFKKLGLEDIQVATQNDVNGIGWCFNEYFPEIGVKYLTMGVNLHKAIAPFDMPTYFWWTSPSGKRMLAYYGEHYMHGNGLGVNGTDFDAFENKLLGYLRGLEQRDFKYDIMGCEFLGIGGDNSAPSKAACEIVKQWNEKYEWPKVRLSLYKDYLGKIEDRYGKDIPAIRGAWPDWWTDGFASGAFESAASRTTQSEMIATQNALSITKLLGSELPKRVYNEVEEVNDCLMFYGEHTYGFDASIWKPFCRETMEQRFLKASYTWEGFRRGRLLGETALGFLKDYISKAEKPSVMVFNPLSWARTGIAKTYIDFSILPLDRDFTITDEYGKEIKAQMVTRKHDGAYWNLWVENVPSFGYKQYFIETHDRKEISAKNNFSGDFNSVSNEWYELKINEKRGTLESIFDKEIGRNILEESSEWKFGELIHEKLDSRFLDRKVMEGYARKVPANMKFTGYSHGELWDTYSFAGHSEAGIGDGDNMNVEFRVYNCAKRIDVHFGLTKKLDTNPEAVYVAFPFALPDAKIYFDVPGGVIEAGVDQIQGTSNEWSTIQTFAAVRNKESQIVIGTPEVPLMQLGNINTGRFKKEAVPESNEIFSYVMNNYWTTNFNADQHGEFQWNYFITSMPGNSLEQATKFAWENRIPCIARTLPAGKNNGKAKFSDSFLSINPQNVLVVNMKPLPNENAILLHLREVDGKEAHINLQSKVLKNIRLTPSNVLGEEIPTGSLVIKPWETKFVKLSW